MKITADVSIPEKTDRNKDSKKLAEASVLIRHEELGDLTIKGFSVVQGPEGPFVSLPQRSYKNKKNETAYFRTVTSSKSWKELFDESILQAYSDSFKKKAEKALASA